MRLIDELILDKSAKEKRKIKIVDAARECGVEYRLFYNTLVGGQTGKKHPEETKKIAKYFGYTADQLTEMLKDESYGK